MRKIEAKMNKAMRHFLPFSSGNTTVVQNDRDMDVFYMATILLVYVKFLWT